MVENLTSVVNFLSYCRSMVADLIACYVDHSREMGHGHRLVAVPVAYVAEWQNAERERERERERL